MTTQHIIWLVIAAYVILMAVIAILSMKSSKSITDFTVGGRNAGAWLSALSYGTAYFSAVMFVGYAGTSGWRYGLWSVLPGIGNAIFGSLFAWLVLANRTRDVTRRLKIKSMPQFFEKRFNSQPMKMFAVVVIFLFLIPYSASVYKGLTSVCSVLLKVDPTICMIVIAAASALLLVLGGYAATLKADFVQGIVMFVGVVLLIIFVVRSEQVGGLTEGIARMKAEFNHNLPASEHVGLWATVLMTSFGTWGLPQMIHKYYGIRDKREVKRGTIISTIFALLIAGGGYFVGSFAHIFFKGGQLPEGGVDYIIPNMLEMAKLPNLLLGVVLVLLIAASVSTLSAITLTACSTVSMDWIRARLKPDINPQKLAVVTKVLCLLFVAASFVIANTSTPILDMMSYSWGIISGSFLAPYLISLYWKKFNKIGAWAGMLCGFFVSLPPIIAKLFVSPDTSFGKLALQGPLFACIAMAASLVMCIAVSLITNAVKAKGSEENTFFYEGTVS